MDINHMFTNALQTQGGVYRTSPRRGRTKTRLFLLASLLCLIAFQNGKAICVSASEVQDASFAHVTSDSKIYQQDAISNELSVPIQIVMEEEEPVHYATPKKRAMIGTTAQLNHYTKWISSLSGKDVTDFYGYSAPALEYSLGEMNMGDSNTLFHMLQSIKLTMLPAAQRNNPPTGGGWSLSIQTAQEKAVISFNGQWLMVYFNGEKDEWIFKVQEGDAIDLALCIDTLLDNNMNNGAANQPALSYQGKPVDAFYAFNANAYIMAKVDGYQISKQILAQLEREKPQGNSPDGLGYLIFTPEEKKYIYLDKGNVNLTKSALETLQNAPLHPSWLVHMSPERMVSANGITDKETLQALSTFLKEEVNVQPVTTSFKGRANPATVAGLYTLNLEFDSGIFYDIIGYDYYDKTSSISIYTSDLDRTVRYDCDPGIFTKLRLLLESNPS